MKCLSRLLAFAVVCAAPPIQIAATPLPGASDTLFVTVAQDGSGDVSTIQDGFGFPGEGYPRVIRVMPGHYDEIVNLGIPPATGTEVAGERETTTGTEAVQNQFDVMLIAPAGPEETTVRGFAPTGADYALISGFGIEEQVIHRPLPPIAARWENCIFMGGYVGESGFCLIPNLFRCEFRGPTRLMNYSSHYVSFEDLRFTGAGLQLTTSNEGNCGPLRFVRCEFQGPADTAVFVFPKGENFVEFSECTFTGFDQGIVVQHNPDEAVFVNRSRFTDVQGAAIGLEFSGELFGEPTALHVGSSRFERCGRAVRYMPSLGTAVAGRMAVERELDRTSWFNGSFAMVADTIIGCTGPAIEAQIFSGGGNLEGLIIEDGADAAVLLTGMALRPSWSGVRIIDSRVTGNAGVGLKLVDPAGGEADSAVLIRNNLIARNGGHGMDISASDVRAGGNVIHHNGGDGFRLHTPTGSQVSDVGLNTIVFNQGTGLLHTADSAVDPASVLLHNNLVARNGGEGIRADGVVRHNDGWMNEGGDFAGARIEENLSTDPAFCDAGAEDFMLVLGSPCGPDGPYGQIGALGIGCSPTATRISLQRAEVVDGIVRLSWHTDEPIASARVERRTETTPWIHVGLASDGGRDLLSFEEPAPASGPVAYRLAFADEGASVYAAETWVEIPAASFSVRAPNPVRGRTIPVELSFPSAGAVRVELLDPAGRRVADRRLSARVGTQSLTLGRDAPIAPGVYLIRVVHAGESRTERVVVLH